MNDIASLIDIHSANSSQQIPNQTRLKLNILSTWHPINHHYVILQVQLIPLNNNYQGWKQLVVLDNSNLEQVSQLDDLQLKQVLNQDLNEMLLKANLNHQQNYNYVFVSNRLPTLARVIEKRKTLAHQLNLVFKTQLVPILKEQVLNPNLTAIEVQSKQFYINLSQVAPHFISFIYEPQGKSSWLSLHVELISSERQSMSIMQDLTLPISYYDYSKIYWIYNSPEFEAIQPQLINVQPVIDNVLKRLSLEKKRYQYLDLEFILGKFRNFNHENQFLLNDNHKGDVINNFLELNNLGIYSGLVQNVQKSSTSANLLQLTLNDTNTPQNSLQGLNLLIGLGGMSLNQHPIYDPRNSTINSLQHAKQILIKQVNNPILNPKIQALIALYDGRQTNSAIIKKVNDNQHQKAGERNV